MAKVRNDRTRWITAGLRLLDEHGAQGISIERLARRLSVTRGSFRAYPVVTDTHYQ